MDYEYEDIDDYCEAKSGSVQFEGGHSLGGKKNVFCYFSMGYEPYTLTVRVLDSAWDELEENHQVIESEYFDSKAKGWTWLDMVVDEGVSWELIKRLIDDSYQTTLDESSSGQGSDSLSPVEQLNSKAAIEELIEDNGLKRKRKEVLKLWKPAVLLRTERTSEARIGLGQSKLGGKPDLPRKFEWPRRDGKPLAFLAQINLNQLSSKPKVAGLPTHGILYFFSSFGWQEKDSLDPLVMEESWGDGNTQVLYCESKRPKLTRQKKPRSVYCFPSASITLETVKRFPENYDDPAVRKLKLRSTDLEKFESLFWDHSSMLDECLEDQRRNFLTGYAEFEQGVDETVFDKKLQLLLQIASDDCADMCWGDDGYLNFWIRPSNLAKADFSTVYTCYQSG